MLLAIVFITKSVEYYLGLSFSFIFMIFFEVCQSFHRNGFHKVLVKTDVVSLVTGTLQMPFRGLGILM